MSWFQKAINLLPIFLLSVILFIIWQILHKYTLVDLKAQISNVNTSQIVFALALVVLNYIILSFYDWIGFKYLGINMRYYRIAFTSFISYSFSQMIGMSLLSSGAVRLRFYTGWGINPKDIGKIVIFSGSHFWLGLLAIGGVAITFSNTSNLFLDWLPQWTLTVLGIISLIIVSTYLILCFLSQGKRNIFGYDFTFPTLKLAVFALSVAILDWIIAASVFYFLLPQPNSTGWITSTIVFLIAQLISAVSHIPGGVGIFEAVSIGLLGNEHSKIAILGALILFRVIYYIVPFIIGGVVFSLYEIKKNWNFISKALEPTKKVVRNIAPTIITYWVFISGMILLASGATPIARDRMTWMSSLPLPIIEMSHFTNSIIGTVLVTVAFGLRRRTKSAFILTRALLILGVITSLLKGLDWEEAILVGFAALFLQLSHANFYRKGSSVIGTSIKDRVFTILALIGFIWLGFFSYKHIEYSHSLWWQFALNNDASRFLRSCVLSACGFLCIYFWKLSLISKPKLNLPNSSELDEAYLLIQKYSHSSDANMALLGDKYFIWNEDRSGFVMFAIQGRSWIAYGEPVAQNIESKTELIWLFLESADYHGGLCCFYQVPSDDLYLYIDVGLKPYKIGEYALIDLDKFNLEGARNKSFRHNLNKLKDSGYTFKILSPEEGVRNVIELKRISDDWLEGKSGREKGFSLGFFDEKYLSRCKIATVQINEKIIAFCNIIESADKFELSVDLMRYGEDSPSGTMDFIFINLMLWGKENGYKYFNLGMAPLAGFVDHRLAPLWFRFISMIYERGESLYNFEGIRNYKNKFHPDWEPRYLVTQGGFAVGNAVANITSLISGGLLGVIKK